MQGAKDGILRSTIKTRVLTERWLYGEHSPQNQHSARRQLAGNSGEPTLACRLLHVGSVNHAARRILDHGPPASGLRHPSTKRARSWMLELTVRANLRAYRSDRKALLCWEACDIRHHMPATRYRTQIALLLLQCMQTQQRLSRELNEDCDECECVAERGRLALLCPALP